MITSKYAFRILIFTLAILLVATPAALAAFAAPEPDSPESLAFTRIKITGEEYVEIQNNSSEDIDDLSTFAIRAYNDVDPSAEGAKISMQALPRLKLEQGARLLLSTGIRPTCGAAVSGKLSLSLVDGGGTIQIVRPAGPVDTSVVIVDYVNWSSAANGAIQSVPSFSKAPLSTYYRYEMGDGTYGWQKANQDTEDDCALIVPAPIGSEDQAEIVPLGNRVEDQAFTVTSEEELTIESSPPSDTGSLKPVEISELLPNPIGTGNDATDEYIELYNPNQVAYDLSGYVLRSGISAMRYFTIPETSTLPPKAYGVFRASETGLQLSNTISQVILLNPDKEIIFSTDVYRSAKDGQSWLRNNNRWEWSSTPTPGRANIMTAPIISQKSATKPSSTKKSVSPKTPKAPKAPKAAKPKKEKKPKVEKAAKYSALPTAATVESRPIQARVIAIVALIALLYGAYEYRGDLANKFQQCRRYVSARRPHRR